MSADGTRREATKERRWLRRAIDEANRRVIHRPIHAARGNVWSGHHDHRKRDWKAHPKREDDPTGACTRYTLCGNMSAPCQGVCQACADAYTDWRD